MTPPATRQAAYSAVRLSPAGDQVAWYRPAFIGDNLPWLVIAEDQGLHVEYHWMPESAVANWLPLEDPAVVLADDRAARSIAVAAAVADTCGGAR